MTITAIPTPDGHYLDVFVAITFNRIGGRKLIIAPGLDIARSAATDATLVKALVRAYRWAKLLEDGIYSNIAELADKEKINRSYVSRTLRLTFLAPDIVECILEGRQPPTLKLADLEAPFPIEWGAQRHQFGITCKEIRRKLAAG